MTIGVGLIGLGQWGLQLLRVFRGLEGVEVVLASDSNPKCSVDGLRTVRSAAEVYASPSVDAVLIATPISSHYELARNALLAGKHCWVEKPLATSVTQARELVDMARERGRVLFVDETFLYDPLLEQVKQWMQVGRIGRIRHLSFERLGMGRIRRDSDVWWNFAPHDLAILRFLLPVGIESLRVERFSLTGGREDRADACHAILRLSGGISAEVRLSWLWPVKAASVVVTGERGLIRYEGRFGQRFAEFCEYRLGEPRAHESVIPILGGGATETIWGGKEEPLAFAAAAFVRSIRDGHVAPSDGRFSLSTVELLAAGAAAAQAGSD